jgi:hypothetical protein
LTHLRGKKTHDGTKQFPLEKGGRSGKKGKYQEIEQWSGIPLVLFHSKDSNNSLFLHNI